ncbi:ABC transporter ATP-binding protein [Sinosporangium siamense]|uniref:ABC transporter ATP-binding protein n=1 Tax=Sinosporangium siamense TaxID=1367973 RepID=A0A919RA98_9ACTN|nr:ATP-binding cassette domain-containing protein [Sinosporangium siamense]GII90023.1 ABC transporter ATP-binding protein [Sinosporangium siamense]
MTLSGAAADRRTGGASAPLIRVDGLRVVYPEGEAVRGISLTVAHGECVAIVGASGAGKSAAVRALAGLAGAGAAVRAARFEIYGRDARGYGVRDFRRLRERSIGVVPADRLLPYGMPRGVEDEIAEVLGGGRDLIVLDDPLAALDPVARARVLTLVAARRAGGAGVLMTGHDLGLIAAVADRVLVMSDGLVVEEGPAGHVLGDPRHEHTRRLFTPVPSAATRGTRLTSARTGPKRPARPVDTASAVVEASGVTLTHCGREIVREVSLRVHAGETVGVIGESGSGKSTLAALLLGYARPTRGEVELHGRAWSSLPERSRRPWRSMVQLVSQEPLARANPRHTLGRILAEPLGALPGPARRARVAELLERVGLPASTAALRPGALSRGQRQRAALARALGPRPDLIVCDEPVSALDAQGKAAMLDLLADVQREDGTALVFISHDLGTVHHVGDRVLVMRGGRVIEEGNADDVLFLPRHPRTRSLLSAASPILMSG